MFIRAPAKGGADFRQLGKRRLRAVRGENPAGAELDQFFQAPAGRGFVGAEQAEAAVSGLSAEQIPDYRLSVARQDGKRSGSMAGSPQDPSVHAVGRQIQLFLDQDIDRTGFVALTFYQDVEEAAEAAPRDRRALPAALDEGRLDDMSRDGDSGCAAEGGESAVMIQMGVRDDYKRDIPGRYPQRLQAAFQIAGIPLHPRIDQYAVSRAPDDEGAGSFRSY